MLIKYLNIVFIFVFLLSAAVQYNDPEPVRWMAIYLTAALICILFAIGRGGRSPAMLLSAIASVWAVLKIPDLTVSGFRYLFSEVQMMQQGTEAAREFLGLLIVAGWMMFLAITIIKRERKPMNTVQPG